MALFRITFFQLNNWLLFVQPWLLLGAKQAEQVVCHVGCMVWYAAAILVVLLGMIHYHSRIYTPCIWC